MFVVVLVLFVAAVILQQQSIALDLKFSPNAENEPLPLSQNYRNSLRDLCNLINKGGDLPENIKQQQDVLGKMCFKLAKDDANAAYADNEMMGFMGGRSSSASYAITLCFIVALFSAYYLLYAKPKFAAAHHTTYGYVGGGGAIGSVSRRRNGSVNGDSGGDASATATTTDASSTAGSRQQQAASAQEATQYSTGTGSGSPKNVSRAAAAPDDDTDGDGDADHSPAAEASPSEPRVNLNTGTADAAMAAILEAREARLRRFANL